MKNIINKICKIADILDKNMLFQKADIIDRNLITLTSLMEYKMTKIIKNAGTAEDEIQKLLIEFLPNTDFKDKVFSIGGYERDALLGRPSKDLDIVIEETGGAKRFGEFLHNTFPEETSRAWPLGENYPIWHIAFRENVTYNGKEFKTSGGEIDIADTQKESFPDAQSRQRETQSATLEEDIERRDFTVNMLLRDLTTGELRDITGTSKSDIEKGILRGHPNISLEKIFQDDPLRMLRLIRFQCKYGWDIPFSVLRITKKIAPRIEIVSWERVREELEKMAKLGKLGRAIQLMKTVGLLQYILPEVQTMVGIIQTHKGKKVNIYQHTLLVLDKAAPTIEGQFGALLHDIGKIVSKSTEIDKTKTPNHPQAGAEIAKAIMDRLKFEKKTTDIVSKLVALHMEPRTLVNADIFELRQFIRKIKKEMVDILLDLAEADALGREDPKEHILGLREKFREAVKIPIGDNPILNGDEIMELLNLKKGGKIIGQVINFLKELEDKFANDGKILNKEEAKLEVLKKFKSQTADDPKFSELISEIEEGNFQFVNTYSDNPRGNESPYNQGGRGPMQLSDVSGPQ